MYKDRDREKNLGSSLLSLQPPSPALTPPITSLVTYVVLHLVHLIRPVLVHLSVYLGDLLLHHVHLLLHHLPVCHRPNNIHHLPNWSNTNIIICTITSSNYPFYSPKMLLMTILVSILVTSSATMGTSSSSCGMSWTLWTISGVYQC